MASNEPETSEPGPNVIRPTDAEAIRLAKTLIRTAKFGALAAIEPGTGHPLASRVGVAADLDGTPIVLVSMLSAHTRAILADPRTSLLLGEPGKGDALAYARITLFCRAVLLENGAPSYDCAQRRFLSRNPKAAHYAGLGDFRLFHLEVERASLNGGFGKAFNLTRDDLQTNGEADLVDTEQSALEHMNADHRDAIDLYAAYFAGAKTAGWIMTGIDADGFDIASGDQVRRVFFPAPLAHASELRVRLIEMAELARAV